MINIQKQKHQQNKAVNHQCFVDIVAFVGECVSDEMFVLFCQDEDANSVVFEDCRLDVFLSLSHTIFSVSQFTLHSLSRFHNV